MPPLGRELGCRPEHRADQCQQSLQRQPAHRELGIRKKYTEELKNRNEIKRFIDSQLACWPLAHHNHEALQTVQTKELSINGYTFVVQCNAQRAVSTTAKVDKDSIQARPCFLCKENQPKEQKALETITANRICVNPYPILPDHLTIAHKDHIPQLMDENIFSYDDVRAFVQKYPTTPYSIMEHIAEPLHRTISIFKESEKLMFPSSRTYNS